MQEGGGGEDQGGSDQDDTVSLESTADTNSAASGVGAAAAGRETTTKDSEQPSISIMNHGGSTSTLGISLSYDLDKLGSNVSALDMVLGESNAIGIAGDTVTATGTDIGTGTGSGAEGNSSRKRAPPNAFVKGLPPRATSGGVSFGIDTKSSSAATATAAGTDTGKNSSPRAIAAIAATASMRGTARSTKAASLRVVPMVLKPTIPRVPLHAPKRPADVPVVITRAGTAGALRKPTKTTATMGAPKGIMKSAQSKDATIATSATARVGVCADENNISSGENSAPQNRDSDKDRDHELGSAISDLSQRIRKRLEFTLD
jgi:hypothetical protein